MFTHLGAVSNEKHLVVRGRDLERIGLVQNIFCAFYGETGVDLRTNSKVDPDVVARSPAKSLFRGAPDELLT